MSDIDLQGGGSNLPIITTRAPANDESLAWGDHYEVGGWHDFPDLRVWGGGKYGWVVHTVRLGTNPYNGADQPPYEAAAKHVLNSGGLFIRLNDDYGRTIPPNENNWLNWANGAADWLKALLDHIRNNLPNKHAATIVACLGNEQNAAGEWGGAEITPEKYAKFFNLCYKTIKAKCPNVMIAPGALAWYGPTSYWDGRYLTPRQWWDAMIANIVDLDAIALHTYSHTDDPASVTWDRKFGDWPMQDTQYDFRNYIDQMEAIPERWRFVPIHITETNAGAELTKTPAWTNRRTGWIIEAYREIARWNAVPHNQQIHMLALFCWSRRVVGNQEYGVEDKGEVIAEFMEAMRTIDTRRFVPNWLPPYANRPYSSQLAAGAWKYSADCGHACVKEVLTLLGLALTTTIDQLVDMIRQNTQGYSTGGDLVRLFGYFGVTAAYLYDQSPNRGDICLIDYSKISQRFDKNYTGLHWLTYLGEKDRNAVVNDPDYYGQGGRNREYIKTDFEASLTGWVVRIQQ